MTTATPTNTFRQMVKDGTAKRADAMKFRIEDIHEEPGFNLRREGEDLEASIDALAAHIRAGGMLPPLEVRPRPDGGVFLVDGHRRRRAYLRAADDIRDGDGQLFVNVVAFTGNDADRIARVITSAEGRSLSPLEIAEGYRRLVALNWTPDQIAAKVGKTRQHVDQLLILGGANADVHSLVAAGSVSATTAIDIVRKHGEAAGAILSGEVNKAKAAGKAKATAGAVKGKSLPRGIVDELVGATDGFVKALPHETLHALSTMKLSDPDVDPLVAVPARQLFELMAVAEAVAETKAKQASRGMSDATKAANADIEDAAAAA